MNKASDAVIDDLFESSGIDSDVKSRLGLVERFGAVRLGPRQNRPR